MLFEDPLRLADLFRLGIPQRICSGASHTHRGGASRLWCIFELAAYRRANPGGKITLAPLFVETTVAALCVGAYLFLSFYHLCLLFLGARGTLLAIGAGISPAYFIFHVLRSEMRTKRQLFSEMNNFKLQSVQCREEFDRDYIHTAIARWYGSHGAFEAFVRGPLREELLSSQAHSQSLMHLAFFQSVNLGFQG